MGIRVQGSGWGFRKNGGPFGSLGIHRDSKGIMAGPCRVVGIRC